MRKELKVAIIGMILGVVGFTLIYLVGGWLLVAGVFIAMWGNNISERASRVRK